MITLSDLHSSMKIIAPYNRNSNKPYDLDGQVCKRCGAYKLIDHFGRGSNYKAGFNTRCKQCLSEVKQENRIKKRHAIQPKEEKS